MAARDVVDGDMAIASELLDLLPEHNLVVAHDPVDEHHIAAHVLEQRANGCDTDASCDQRDAGLPAHFIREEAEGPLADDARSGSYVLDAAAEVAQVLDGDAHRLTVRRRG